MDKLPWQGAIEFNENSYQATTSLVIDKKNGWTEYSNITKFLDDYIEMYSKALHIALSELSKNKSITEVKRRLCVELNVKSRVADSAINEAKTILSAQRELLKTRKKDLNYERKKLKSELKKEEKDYKDFRNRNTNWGKPSKGMVVENKAYRKRIYFLKDKINRSATR